VPTQIQLQSINPQRALIAQSNTGTAVSVQATIATSGYYAVYVVQSTSQLGSYSGTIQ
jgi:hypothetical protein